MTVNQPIPVSEAIEAVKAAIEVCTKATRGPWRVFDDDEVTCIGVPCTHRPMTEVCSEGGIHAHVMHGGDDGMFMEDAVFVVAARAGYAATLEYLLYALELLADCEEAIVQPESQLCASLAPVVEWHQARRQPTDETYPCEQCGKLRTKAEGGTTFTVCDECWKSHSPYDVHKACNYNFPCSTNCTGGRER